MTQGRTATQQCNRCRARIPANARRCMLCGAQVYVAPVHAPEEAERLARERLVRRYGLTEMQQAILVAAADASGDRQIFVCGREAEVDGEVKSGGRRFGGNEAVAAIAALAAPGLIRPAGEDCFKLTPDGARLADALTRSGPDRS